MDHALSRWTPAQTEELTRRWLAGEPIETIAKAVGKTAGSVKIKRARLGLPPRRHPELDYSIRVWVSTDMYAELSRRAAAGRATLSEVVRGMIVDNLRGSEGGELLRTG